MKYALDLQLPTGPELPPPPPMKHEAFIECWLSMMADFYRSPHYAAWERRTADEMRGAEPFVWID